MSNNPKSYWRRGRRPYPHAAPGEFTHQEWCGIRLPDGTAFKIVAAPEPGIELEMGKALPEGTPFEIQAGSQTFTAKTLKPKQRLQRLPLPDGLLEALMAASAFALQEQGTLERKSVEVTAAGGQPMLLRIQKALQETGGQTG